MPFNTLKNLNFAGAGNTAVGNGDNSTTGVPGLTDYAGDKWNIDAGVLGNQRSGNPGTNPPLNCLYDAQNSYKDGRALVYSGGVFNSCGMVARFNPASGGSGYCLSQYGNDTFFFWKSVNGAQSKIGQWAIVGTIPANAVYEGIVVSNSTTESQLTLNIYAPSNLTTPVLTKTITDTTAELQNTAGFWGIGCYSATDVTRFSNGAVDTAIQFAPIVVSSLKRTGLRLDTTEPTGGVGSVTHVWQKALGNGSFANLSGAGATDIARVESSLSPATLYRYRLAATDDNGTVYSDPISATTVALSTRIVGYAGHSQIAGVGASDVAHRATTICNAALVSARPDLFAADFVVSGVGGSTVQMWLDTYAGQAVSGFGNGEVNEIHLVLGANDAPLGVTAQQYHDRMLALCNYFLSGGLSSDLIIRLHQPAPRYDQGSNNATANALLQDYSAQLDLICNGTTIRRGDRTLFDYIVAHQELLTSDLVHFNDAGQAQEGNRWAAAALVIEPPTLALIANGNTSSSVSVTQSDSSDATHIQLQLDGDDYQSPFALAPNATTTRTVNAANGTTHSVTAIALDGAGNESAPSEPVTIAPVAPVQGDTTRPTAGTPTLAANGLTLTVPFSETVTGSTGFTVKVAGTPRAATVAGSGASRVLTFSSAAYAGQAVTLDYTPGNIADVAGNALLAFTALAVTNGSTVPVPEEPPIDPSLVTLTLNSTGTQRAGQTFVLTTRAAPPIVLNGAIESTRIFKATTDEDGLATFTNVPPSSLLRAANRLDTYSLKDPVSGAVTEIRVPDGGGNVFEMIVT